MGSAASVTIEGIDDLTKKLNELGANVPKEFGKIGKKAMALLVEKAAKEKCPVDTGNLRASISTQQTDDFTIQTGTNVEYAPHVEYGTSRQSAHPYLRPAFDENKDAVVERIRADLEAVVEKYKK